MALPRGVYLSSDDGGSWTAVNNGLRLRNDSVVSVNSIVVSGSNIFAGTDVGGVFLSTNNCASWTAVNNGLTDTFIYSMVVSGSNIFAGSNGVFLSANNGNSWTAVDSGLVPGDVGALFVHDTNIYAAVLNGSQAGNTTIFLSTNNGGNWVPVDSELWRLDVTSLAFIGDDIFAGTAPAFGSNNAGVYLSRDNGMDWMLMDSGMSIYTIINSLVVSGSNIFAGTSNGVYLSVNNGVSWESIGLADTFVKELVINDSDIFAGTFYYGVWQRPLADFPTGIEQGTAPAIGFRLYPNPSSSSFIIETNVTGEQQLQLFDLTGKLLLTKSITNSKTTIDASRLAAGVYLVSLKNAGGVVTQKLVIAR